MNALTSYNRNSYVFSFARWAVSQIIRASTDTILSLIRLYKILLFFTSITQGESN